MEGANQVIHRVAASGITLLCAAFVFGCTNQPVQLSCPLVPGDASTLALQEPFANELARLSDLQRRRFTDSLSTKDEEQYRDLSERYRIRGIVGGRPTPAQITEIAKRNAIISAQYTSTEKAFRPSRGANPARCIALSGGGSRSALVNLGVLFSHEYRNEPPFDVYSAVSGGGYALGWFVIQKARHKADQPVFVFNNGPHSADSISASLINLSIAAPTSVGCLIQAPFQALLPTLAGAHNVPSNYCRDSYSAQIASAYGISPTLTRQQLTESLSDAKFGLPIWNWSVFPVKAGRILSFDPHDTFAEVSPIGFGSDGLGYTQQWPTPIHDLTDVIAISGAAIDRLLDHTDHSGHFQKPWIQLGGGGRLSGVCSRTDVARGATSNSLGDIQTEIYVSDGGEVDNLGLLPLVKRMCSEIVVIDAEYDPHWTFEGLSVAKQRLLKDYGIELEVDPQLEHILLDTRGSKTDRADGITLVGPRETCNASTKYQPGCWYSRRTVQDEYRLRIGPIPVWVDEQVEWRILKVRYIKAGSNRALERYLLAREKTLAQQAVTPQIRALHERYAAWWLESCSGNQRATCAFPQTPTTNQALTSEEARAYLQLGNIMYSAPDYAMRIEDWDEVPNVLRPPGLRR